LLNLGLAHVDAGLGALLFATFPLMTMTIATGLGRERFDVPLAAGVSISIVGVAMPWGCAPRPCRAINLRSALRACWRRPCAVRCARCCTGRC
jgi:hypothetical protein